MIDQTLYFRLAPVASREQRYRVAIRLAIVWFAATAAGIVLWWMKTGLGWQSSWVFVAWLGVTAVASLIVVAMAIRRVEDFRYTVRRIESAYPDLDSVLQTAVEQQPATAHGTLGYLQQDVVRKAVYHGYQNPWSRSVSRGGRSIAWLCCGAALAALFAVAVGQLLANPLHPSADKLAFEQVVIGDSDFQVTVEPGDTEVEMGTGQLVLARFQKRLPTEVALIYRPQSMDGASPENELAEPQQLVMSQSLDDPVFAERITNILEPMEYWVEYAGRRSERYRIGVFQYPQLERLDVKIVYPEYTQLPERLIQDVSRISCVEGSQLTFLAHLNKPVKTAKWMDADGQELALQADDDPRVMTAQLVVTQSRKLQLQLVDEAGRANRSPPTFLITAQSNQVPQITLLQPGGDSTVSPLEELQLQAQVWDDLGIQRAGLSYTIAGQPENEWILAEDVPAKTQSKIGRLMAFEELQVQPDQLVTYYFWAEDLGADGEMRRTAGDMYFAEVRKFDEIFREGQSPPGGQQQQPNMPGGENAQQAGQLAELQKQIINATWKILRREEAEQLSEEFAPDLQLVSESQATVMEQLTALSQHVETTESTAIVEQAQSQMQQVIDDLNRGLSGSEIAPVRDALAAEQAAYQSLLKLRASEHQVARGQQSGAAGRNSSRPQQQINQLQLNNEQNRYETQRLAQPPESPEQRENRQILSRLRELARRQHDLNKRIKELQSALQEAKSQAEKDEIEQQLKRLREQQQQILRDTEELQERMERPENQSRLSEQAERLEQVRENIRESSEALAEGEVSRAAAEGTRAERELKELRDELQKQTSGQFNEAVREMRNEARDIEKQQQDISQQLRDADRELTDQRSLSGPDRRSELTDQLGQQSDRVQQLRDSMRDLIEQSEEVEPILAEKLYDTYRKTEQQSPERALQSTRDSLERGLINDARREERRAGAAIRTLREGIDKAAESVLGDETQALRRANEDLQRLTREVQDELNEATGDSRQAGDAEPNRFDETPGDPADNQNADAGTEGQPREGQPSEGQPSEGQPSDGQTSDGQPSEGQPSEGQPSEGQPGEGQPSEGQPGGRGDPSQPSDPNQRGAGRSDQQADQSSNRDNGRPGDRNPFDLSQGDPDPRGLADPFQFEEPADSGAPRIRPIAGEDFLDWSDRLRNVEEMIADPELRAEAARIRDAAKAIRKDVRRHSEEPNWEMVQLKIVRPLVELQGSVQEELLRRSADKSLVPIDRDPVPAEFENAVRRYFEQLGRGQ